MVYYLKYILYIYKSFNAMAKKYFYTTLLLLTLFSAGAYAQDNKGLIAQAKSTETIEGLNIYPNPTSSDRVYITSKYAQTKTIEIYDVLGKKMLQATITGKELNISGLTAGVYIIKIKEGDATATRKLIVR